MRQRGSNKLIVLIVVILLILVAVLVFSVTSLRSTDTTGGIQDPVTDGTDEVIEKTNGASGGIRDFFTGIFNYGDMRAESEALKERIAKLEEEKTANTLAKNDLDELRELADVFKYDIADEGGVVSAGVISYDGSNWLDTFTIDVGSKDGVSVDSVVLTGDGLVGRVVTCEAHHAKVVSVVDSATSTSFCLADDKDVLGMLEGNGKGSIDGYILDEKKEINEGDVLVTSGVGLYPGGLNIGTVTKVVYNENTQLKTIEAKPAVDFSAVTKVVVVK